MAGIDQLPARLRDKITVLPSGCWEWRGDVNSKGYGIAYVGDLACTTPGKLAPAHKLIYEVLVEPVAESLTLDHLCHTNDETCQGGPSCRHRRCVNPEDQEQITRGENTLRGNSPWAMNARKTTCPQGHDYDSVNNRGERICLRCARERRRAVS